MDVVIYMREKDFNHKTDKDVYAYWSMGRVPKNFKAGERIYIAVRLEDEECFVRGFVVCNIFDPDDLGGETLQWDGYTWKEIFPGIPCKPFRGFRYKWWK